MMTATSNARFKLVGISDETVCECCGKQNLKRTVVLEQLDADGGMVSVVKFGRDCAARALRVRWTAGRVESAAIAAQAEREREERSRVHTVGESRSVVDWVIASVSGNGDCRYLARANGSRADVRTWAAEKWPNLVTEVVNPNEWKG